MSKEELKNLQKFCRTMATLQKKNTLKFGFLEEKYKVMGDGSRLLHHAFMVLILTMSLWLTVWEQK